MTPTAAPPAPPAADPWAYRGVPGFFDEATADGKPRPHWRPLLDALRDVGPAEFALRWQEGRRVLQANGVTYNVYGDPNGLERPWELDPVPLVIAPAEWATLERGVVQRATLLNRIIADLLGPQKLIHDRLLPPELVFGNPGFLRACHGHAHAPALYLHLYAADLARNPAGQWWVMSDRTQSPSGSGYALENRAVLSRMLPDALHDAGVRGLGAHVQETRDLLIGLARTHRDNPRVVLWTPGPYNETYFEHAYMARHLGVTLVEGGDLTVRDGVVFLKTLSGLLPVDVILRRLDDSFCDPLELRGDSTLGVPGLVQAVRAGRVVVANALGTGLLDAPAVMAFLPILCRLILGEELIIPSVATWWCGHAVPLQHVLTDLERLVIKPALSNRRNQSLFPERMTAAQREELRARLKSEPHAWVAQESVRLATAPAWVDGRLAARHWTLRVNAVSGGGGYRVMPGGLTRFSASDQTQEVSMQRGGGSKDTWVSADAPSPAPAASSASRRTAIAKPVDVNRASFDLPSRVADNLFWLGRYAHRVEAQARALRVTLARFAEDMGDAPAPALTAALTACARVGILNEVAPADDPDESRRRVQEELLAAVFDVERSGSLRELVARVHRVAWTVRDRVSRDSWRVLNRLDGEFLPPTVRQPLEIAYAQDVLDEAVGHLAAFAGLVAESMTRSQGWRFLDLGRRVEWAAQKLDRLWVTLSDVEEPEGETLQWLLEVADSAMTYRARYLTQLRTDLVLDLLLIDEANPRSVAYQFARLSEHIECLPYRPGDGRRSPESRLALEALTAVRLADVEELTWADASGHRPHLSRLLTRLRAAPPALSDQLTASYLTYAVPLRPLDRPAPEPLP